jgi:uncharacterized protein YgiM (DUF1202 family)
VLLASALLVRADGQVEPEKAKAAPEKPAKKAAAKPAKPTKAAKPVKKEAAAPAAIAEKPIVLMPGAATIKGNNVNVRGKAGYKGEVFTKLQNGEAITVIEQVILEKPKAGEPSQWAKIASPASAHVWVHSSYIDENKIVKPKKLNVRSGPGENYSVVGTIEHGVTVKEVSSKANWIEIEAPAGAFGFVAASFVQQTVPDSAVPTVVSIAPPSATETVPTGPDLATNITEHPGVIATGPGVEPIPTVTPSTAVPPAELIEVEVPRTVSHEGLVKGTVSIQAPTKFGLYSLENGKLVNYLLSPAVALDLNRYYGRHIIVTGEEGLDERWTNTPVLTVKKIYVVP